jgi:hypothetical protein
MRTCWASWREEARRSGVVLLVWRRTRVLAYKLIIESFFEQQIIKIQTDQGPPNRSPHLPIDISALIKKA